MGKQNGLPGVPRLRTLPGEDTGDGPRGLVYRLLILCMKPRAEQVFAVPPPSPLRPYGQYSWGAGGGGAGYKLMRTRLPLTRGACMRAGANQGQEPRDYHKQRSQVRK